MAITILTPYDQTTFPFDLDIIKKNVAVEYSGDDDLLTEYGWEAVDFLEKRLGQSILQTQYQLTIPDFGVNHLQWGQLATNFEYNIALTLQLYQQYYGKKNYHELPYPPLKSVDLIQYYDTDNTLQTFTDFYVVYNDRGLSKIVPNDAFPSVYLREDSVQIQFTTKSVSDSMIKGFIRNFVAWKFRDREGGEIPDSLCNAAESICFNIYAGGR